MINVTGLSGHALRDPTCVESRAAKYHTCSFSSHLPALMHTLYILYTILLIYYILYTINWNIVFSIYYIPHYPILYTIYYQLEYCP